MKFFISKLTLAALLSGALLYNAFPAFSQQGAPQAPEVIAYQADKEEWIERREALGTLIANESIVITANVSEIVAEIFFDSGDSVEQGQTLALLNQTEEQASLQGVKGRVRERELAFERVRNLKKSDFASTALVDERRAALEEARAELAVIESRIKDKTIKAPFSGILGLRNISVGAYVQSGQSLTTLDDISVMKLDFSIPETFLSLVAKDMDIVARSSAYEQDFKGKVQSIDSRIDPVTRSVTVRALIDNPDFILKPGMLMKVDILKEPRLSIIVPEESLLMRGSQQFVFKITEHENSAYLVSQTPVVTGSRQNGMVEIIDGLNAGDKVITHGLQMARDKGTVKLMGLQDKNTKASEFYKSE